MRSARSFATPFAPTAWALGILVLGALVTLVGYRQAVAGQRGRDRARIQRYLQRAELGILARIGAYEDLLHSLQGLLAAKPGLRAGDWETFARQLDLQRHPGVRSLARIVPVAKGREDAFLKEGLREGILYEIHVVRPGQLLLQEGPPTDEARDRFLIQYTYPLPQNPKALGLDVGTYPSQRQAAERARDTGNPGLTGRLLFQDLRADEVAVALFVPVYRGGGVPASVEERRQRSLGWVSVALTVDRFFPELLRSNDDALALLVEDLDPPGPLTLFADPGLKELGGKPGLLSDSVNLKVGGRTWRLTCATLPRMFTDPGRNHGGAWILGGGLASLLLAAVTWFLVGSRVLAEERALHMSRDFEEALQRLQSHIENTPFAVVEWDARGTVQGWNPAAERIFGYRAGAIRGKGPELLDPGDRGGLGEGLRRALQGQGNRLALDVHAASGEVVPCICHHTVVKSLDGRVNGVLSLLEDQREIRRAEEALRLGQKLESLGVLAGGIAHDFNNLLAAIAGNAELALDDLGATVPARRYLEKILATAHRAGSLARQLLVYAGKAPVRVKVLDLDRELEELLELLKASLPKLVRIEFSPGAERARILADPAQIQQVVVNLVTNGAEAIGGREGRVALRTRRVQADPALLAGLWPGHGLKEGPALQLEVKDDGEGMDPQLLSRIFDPFFTTKFQGRGLGLSALLGILRNHSAGLSVQSRPGEGTTFRVYFPEEPAPVAEEVAAPAPVAAKGGGALLFADDEPTLRELARDLLEKQGYQVHLASDGAEALELFRVLTDVRLVILDLTMPRMDGYEVFKVIRQESPATKVVLTSGYTVEDLHRRPGPRPDAFLHKPFRMGDLLELVGRLCGG